MKDMEAEWIKDARKCCRDWTAKYNGQLSILKNEGFRKVQRGKNNGKEVNWNLELVSIGAESLDECFHDFQKRVVNPWPRTLATKLERLCEDARKNIKRKTGPT